MTHGTPDPNDKTKLYGILCDEARILTARRRRQRRLQRWRDRAARHGTSSTSGSADPPAPATAPAPPCTDLPGDAAWTVTVSQLHEGKSPVYDERGYPVPVMTSRKEIVGLSLSGGGVRSASFCLGVLQGLDAVVPDDKRPQMLDAVDYLSTVSGGSYIGAALVTGMMKHGKFPFASKFDQMETKGTQHLRDYSNYIAPQGGLDWAVGVVVLLRGLLINALLIGGLVFIACSVTVAIYSNEGRVGGDWVPGLGWIPVPFVWTGIVFGIFVLLQFPVVAERVGLSPSASASLTDRERIGKRLAILLLGVGIVLVLDLQSFVIKGMFEAFHLSVCRTPDAAGHVPGCRALARQTGWLGQTLSSVGLGSGAPWGSLAAAIAALGTFGSKLVKVAGATFGDQSWGGFLKHWSSRIAVGIGSLVVPLAIWAVYLSLCFAAIRFLEGGSNLACCEASSLPERPDGAWARGAYGLVLACGVLGVGFLVACFLVPTNANSLHGFYRDRLSRAFLGDGDALDRTKLSDLLPPAFGGTSRTAGKRLRPPYLLVNTAVNVEGSRYVNRRGRNADSFIFSPLHSGSEVTGYAATRALQDRDRHVDLATAMAISGAAASANMGASTIRPLTFSLAVLNIRLGYWLPNPRERGAGEETQLERLARRLPPRGSSRGSSPASRGDGLVRWLERSWPVSFAKEAAGQLDERDPMVYLTDGGHFDNLGIYELLKRRCKVIVAADAEADLPMNFESLIRLERCARIDLGVHVDLPWEDLRRWSRKITLDAPHGPKDDPADCVGPHVAVGRIRYTDEDVGVLIYIKACITGDENDLIRDYRRRNPDFPHETTLDQFFTEEQFEAYRALGFHAANSFFLGQDRFGWSPPQADADWTSEVESALKRLNVPAGAVARIVAHQSRATAAHDVDIT